MNSFDDIGWYGSSYLISACTLHLLYHRVFSLFDVKWSYISALFVFGSGSLLCALTRNSITLIVGRAITGGGSAGVLLGSTTVISSSVPLSKRRPSAIATTLMMCLGSILGPLLGGVVSDCLDWRWMFWVNIPASAGTALLVLLLFGFKRKKSPESKFVEKLLQLDLTGAVFLIAAALMLFLLLHFQEQKCAAASAEILGLAIGCGVAVTALVIRTVRLGDQALIPPKVICQRNIAARAFAAFFLFAAMSIYTLFLPTYLQAVKGQSATGSGVSMIAYQVFKNLSILPCGFVVPKLKCSAPIVFVGCSVGLIGCTLLDFVSVGTPFYALIVFEVLASAGLGIAARLGPTGVQTVLSEGMLPAGLLSIGCFERLGGAISVKIAYNVFRNSVSDADERLDSGSVEQFLTAGATAFRVHLNPDTMSIVLKAYARALRMAFITAWVMAILGAFASWFLAWQSDRLTKEALEQGARTRVEQVPEILGSPPHFCDMTTFSTSYSENYVRDSSPAQENLYTITPPNETKTFSASQSPQSLRTSTLIHPVTYESFRRSALVSQSLRASFFEGRGQRLQDKNDAKQ